VPSVPSLGGASDRSKNKASQHLEEYPCALHAASNVLSAIFEHIAIDIGMISP
jgi:hypothetical protein